MTTTFPDAGSRSLVDAERASRWLVAVAAGLAGVAGSYAMVGWGPKFAVVPVDEAVVWLTPARVIVWAITTLGDAGHLLHVALSIAIVAGLYATIVGLARGIGAQLDREWAGIALGSAGVWIATAALVGGFVYGLGPALAVAVVTSVAAFDRESTVTESRRRVLRATAGALPAVGVGIALGRQYDRTLESPPKEVDREAAEMDRTEELLATAEQRSLDVDGMDPLVSEKFYTVDIASTPPATERSSWSLSITGAVENPREYSYDDLLERSTDHRFVTLRCVGDPLNGRKMDNALWTGVPVNELLDEAGPRSGCECVMLRAADGYYEEFPLGALRGGMLAYAMNGQALPRSHGYPVRALVPGHWGEVNVKWLTEIEILEQEAKGFWEKRGWHGTGPVNAVAKLHAVDRKSDGTVEIGGHAYAGTRGVSTVEVSTDGGETWTAATLSDPLPGDDVWRQWRHTFAPESSADVVVRTIDGDGDVQPRERSDAYPSGATGWVRKTIDP